MTRFQLVITGLVTTIWTAAYAKSIARGVDPPQEITVPFLIVLGWVSGGTIRRSRTRAEDDEQEPGLIVDMLQRLLDARKPKTKDATDDTKP